MTTTKYPKVKVQLSGMDGNGFAVLGAVQRELRHHDVPAEEVAAFYAEATSGDYDHLLQTVMAWVSVS